MHYKIKNQAFGLPTFNHIKSIVEDNEKLFLRKYDDVFKRTYVHNPPVITDYHKAIAEPISEMLGMKVKPSYSLISYYENNGVCPLHLDRSQCLWTFDYLVSQDDPEPWILRVSDPLTDDERIAIDETISPEAKAFGSPEFAEIVEKHEWEEINLLPNDGVIYSGTHQWHYRPLPSKGKSTLIFFHFVTEEFEGSLD